MRLGPLFGGLCAASGTGPASSAYCWENDALLEGCMLHQMHPHDLDTEFPSQTTTSDHLTTLQCFGLPHYQFATHSLLTII